MANTKLWKKIAISATAVIGSLVLVIAAGVAVAAVGNDYRFTQRAVQIPLSGGTLSGVVTMPKDRSAEGLVVMIHGDGPVDATQQGLYAPWFEGAADAGYATLSWSKPGVGGSSGDWLAQSMSDRAAEVEAVLDWAGAQGGLPTGRTVLWAASQGGWVFPKVVADRSDIAGVVAVGTAINWLDQGRFNLLAELDATGASDAQRQRAIANSDALRALIARDASYADYLATTTEASPMSEERWGFVKRNAAADAAADLARAAARGIPVLLLTGTHDRNVDVAETKQVYENTFGPALTAVSVDGVHSFGPARRRGRPPGGRHDRRVLAPCAPRRRGDRCLRTFLSALPPR